MLIHEDSVWRKPLAKYTQKQVLKLDLLTNCGPVCAHCGEMGTRRFAADGRPWTVERIIPGVAGGLYEETNIALSCWSCNSRRGANSLEKRVFSLWDWKDMTATWFSEICENLPQEEHVEYALQFFESVSAINTSSYEEGI